PSKMKDDLPVKTVRAPLPEADKIAEAEKVIREQFKKDYAKKTASDYLALAEKLQKLSADTTDNPASAYVLLREARDLAVKAGRADFAFKVVAEISEKYEVDELPARVETLTNFAKMPLSAETAKQFVEVALTQANAMLQDDHIDEAVRVLSAADSAARKANN